MALRGLRPVVEIMFGDFVTLIADQLVNHAAKFHWMYNHQVNVPLVVRTPMEGGAAMGLPTAKPLKSSSWVYRGCASCAWPTRRSGEIAA